MNKTKINFYFVIILILINIIFIYYINQINIHGDGRTHFDITNSIIVNEDKINQDPYRLINGNNLEVRYPIHYPLGFYMITSIFYLFVGQESLKYLSLFFINLTAIFIFIFFRKINLFLAFFPIPMLFLFFSRRIIMSPLMEPVLALYAILFVILSYSYVKSNKIYYIIMAGVFLGILISIKQQGLIYFLIFILSFLIFNFYSYLKTGKLKKSNLVLSNVFFLAIIISLPFLIDQQLRTGTIFYAPGEVTEVTTLFPDGSNNFILNLFRSNIPIDNNSINYLNDIIGYRPLSNKSLFNSFKQFLLFPILNFRSGDLNLQGSVPIYLLISFLLIFFIGLFNFFKLDGYLGIIISVAIFIDLILVFFLNHYLYQYYPLALVLISIIFSFGIYIIYKKSIKVSANYILSFLLMVLFFLILFMSFSIYVDPAIKISGRQSTELLTGYSKISPYIDKIVSEKEVIIASGVYADLYKRYTLWINEGGGSDIPKIFRTQDTYLAKQLIQNNNAEYILFDTSQSERAGVFDSIPKDGLISVINNSNDFELIANEKAGKYDIYLYKVKQ